MYLCLFYCIFFSLAFFHLIRTIYSFFVSITHLWSFNVGPIQSYFPFKIAEGDVEGSAKKTFEICFITDILFCFSFFSFYRMNPFILSHFVSPCIPSTDIVLLFPLSFSCCCWWNVASLSICLRNPFDTLTDGTGSYCVCVYERYAARIETTTQ